MHHDAALSVFVAASSIVSSTAEGMHPDIMQDNEDDKSEPRIKEWVKQLKDEGIN